MRMQRFVAVLTAINLALLLAIAFTQVRPIAAAQDVVPILRGRGLQIVDSLGRVRASITITPSSRVGDRVYPEGVLLRLINTRGGPVVKLGASENGSGLNLDAGIGSFTGVQMLAIDTGSFVRVRNPDGSERMVRP